MTQRRAADKATKTSQAAGHREADAHAFPKGDTAVRELLVAGGLRGFSPAEMFPEQAA